MLLQEKKSSTPEKWMGKVNFIETRSFWHIFRSFDRMWSFYILSLQVTSILLAIYMSIFYKGGAFFVI